MSREATRERLIRYQEQAARERDELKARLEAEYGMTGHPRADMLFSLAWQYGHASGLSEVENHYRELRELVT